jgi:hypothetical protein
MSDQDIITRVIRMCDEGFSAHSAANYERITAALGDIENPTEATEKAARLGEAGPTLASPRFAYPHIKSALRASST